jgi:hemoglobin
MRVKTNRGWLAAERAGLALAALVALLLLFPGRSLAQEKTQGEKPKAMAEKTLYERLGGYDAISAVVEDFIDRLGKDPMFERFGTGRSQDSRQHTKQLVKDQICFLTGGPCAYIGRDTATAHQGLGITQQEWEKSLVHLKASLDKFKVGEKEQKDFLAMIDKLKTDIIEKPKKDAGKDKKPEMAPAKD